MQSESHIKVWDPLVRIFHWVLVATFAIAFITEEDFLTLHVWAGCAFSIGCWWQPLPLLPKKIS